MIRQDIEARLTGDKGQALTPLSWWPAVNAALDDPGVHVVGISMPRQTGKTQYLMMRSAGDLLLVPNAFILFLTAGREQADSIYERKLRRPLLRLLRRAGIPASTIKTTKRGVENTALNSALEIVAANEETIPSRSASLLVIDEGRFIADAIFANAASSVIAARGKILAASTAGEPTGWWHHLVTGSDPEVRVIRVDGNENPYADPKIIGFLGRLLRRILPSAAARDLDNQFAEAGDTFLPTALIEAAIDDGLGEIPASPLPAFAFLDLSRRRDLTSLVVVLRDAPHRPEAADHLIAASIMVWDPRRSPTGEVDFAEVRAALARLPERFPGLERVAVDEGAEGGSVLPFARAHPALTLRVQGFVASANSNIELWSALASRLHARTVSIPRHERLLAELRGLRQESFALGLKWRIVDSSRQVHRDVSLALAGAIHAAGAAAPFTGIVILNGAPTAPQTDEEARRLAELDEQRLRIFGGDESLWRHF